MQSEESLTRQIRAIALPAIVSNITTPVLGLVDVAVTGHLGSASYIGAIAVGSTMFNMLYWLFAFLRMGTAGLTSQAYGAEDRDAASCHLMRAMAMALSIGVVLILLSGPLGVAVLNFIDADSASTAALARQYFRILIWGAPAVLGLYVLNGWLLGMQNTRQPMIVAIIINVVNIGLTTLLVFGFGMKIEGVAMGTLTAQWIGFAVACVVTWRRYHPRLISPGRLLRAGGLKRLFSINFDIFLRTLCLVAVTTWFTRAGAEQGVDILAANALLMQLFMFFSYFSDGFAFAGEALSGKFSGAGDKVMLAHATKSVMRIGWRMAAGFTILYFAGGELVMKVLTDDEGVRATARDYLLWAVTVPLCGIAAFIYDGVAVGLTSTRRMLISVATGMAAFFAIYFSLHHMLGNHALWLAFVAYLAVRGVSLYAMLRKQISGDGR